jgi:hypothetical protein
VETQRVGILGAGGIAREHAIGWRDNAPRGEIVAFADRQAGFPSGEQGEGDGASPRTYISREPFRSAIQGTTILAQSARTRTNAFLASVWRGNCRLIPGDLFSRRPPRGSPFG